jgi:hypothetical protein
MAQPYIKNNDPGFHKSFDRLLFGIGVEIGNGRKAGRPHPHRTSQCASAQLAPCPASTTSGTSRCTAGWAAPSITARTVSAVAPASERQSLGRPIPFLNVAFPPDGRRRAVSHNRNQPEMQAMSTFGTKRTSRFSQTMPVKGSLLPFAAPSTKVRNGPFVTNAAPSTFRR